MKNLGILFLLLLAMTTVSCGKKNESGSSNSTFSSDPYKVSTVEGFVNPNGYPIFQTGTGSNARYYAPTQQSVQVVGSAIQLAASQRIPLNSLGMLRATVSGSLAGMLQPQQQPINQQGLSPQNPIPLTVVSMVIIP